MAEIEGKIKEQLLAEEEEEAAQSAPAAPKAVTPAAPKAAPVSSGRKTSAEIDIIVDDEDE